MVETSGRCATLGEADRKGVAVTCKPFVVRDATGKVVGGGFACSRGSSLDRLRKFCGCGRPATRLCDYPLRGPKSGKTCDAPLCERCAIAVGADQDFCQPHARAQGLTSTRLAPVPKTFVPEPKTLAEVLADFERKKP